MRPARLRQQLPVNFLAVVEIPAIEKKAQVAIESGHGEIPEDRPAWLPALRQEPHFLQHCVLGPEELLVGWFRARELTPCLQRQLTVQVHTILACRVGFLLVLILGFFLGDHVPQPLTLPSFLQSLRSSSWQVARCRRSLRQK